MSDLNLNVPAPQQMHSKKNSVDIKQKLVIDIAGGDGKKKSIISIGGPAGGALLNPRSVNSPKQNLQMQNSLNDDQDDEILITQEDERQIKEVISDINHKAFYGKMLKRTKEIDCGDDETLRALSPRSREIAMVMRIIKGCKLPSNFSNITIQLSIGTISHQSLLLTSTESVRCWEEVPLER